MPQLTLSPATLQLLSPIIPLVTADSDKSGFFNFTSSADTFTSSLNTSFALNMQAGDDTVNLNGRGDDSIFTGSGNDTVYAGRGADNVEGGSGTDRLYGEDRLILHTNTLANIEAAHEFGDIPTELDIRVLSGRGWPAGNVTWFHE